MYFLIFMHIGDGGDDEFMFYIIVAVVVVIILLTFLTILSCCCCKIKRRYCQDTGMYVALILYAYICMFVCIFMHIKCI